MDGNGNELELSVRPLSCSLGAAGADFEVKVSYEFHTDDAVPHVEIKFQEGHTKNCFDRFKGILASHPNYREKKLFENCKSGALSRIRPGEQQGHTGGRKNTEKHHPPSETLLLSRCKQFIPGPAKDHNYF